MPSVNGFTKEKLLSKDLISKNLTCDLYARKYTHTHTHLLKILNGSCLFRISGATGCILGQIIEARLYFRRF